MLGCAFASTAIFPRGSPLVRAPASNFAKCNRHAGLATRSPKKRVRFVCRFGPDDVPDDIKALDELERVRRARLSMEPLPYVLSDETKEKLFEVIPELAEMDRAWQKSMQEKDYDPDDYRVYSWAFKKLLPWAPSLLLQVVVAAATFWASRRAVLFIKARVPVSVLLSTAITVDSIATLALTNVVPWVIVAWAVAQNKTGNDGIRRSAILGALSTLYLFPTAVVASVGHSAGALVIGAFARLVPMYFSLWYWRDLRREVFLSETPLKRAFAVWRALLTFFVIVGGSALRIAGLMFGPRFPSGSLLVNSARNLRLQLGSRFPIALSLCNDPRGIYFGACLLLAASFFYTMYFVMFVSNFFRIRDHRASDSVLTSTLVRAKIYQPDIHPNELLFRSTIRDGRKSFLPAAPMKLRKVEGLLGIDSSYLSSEDPMPILDFLKKEEELMAEDGIDRWMKPRDQQVPLSKDLTEAQRSKNALLSWARPLDEDETGMSFAEFFETLEDNEYVYDAGTGDWIFDKEKAAERDMRNASSSDERNGAQGNGSDKTKSDQISAADVNLFSAPSSFDDNVQFDDDVDGPSATVFV